MKKAIMKYLSVLTIVLSVTLTLTVSETEAKQITSVAQAKQAALKKVPSSHVTEVDTDMDNGVTVYEVSLYKKNKEYDLKFRASDGKLIEYNWELPNTSYSIQNRNNIAQSTIKTKACKLVKGARVNSIHLSIDDGLSEYKLTLTKGSKKYKLVYNAKNGKLLEYEWKIVSTGSGSSSKYIGKTKAQNIALKKAPGATVVKVEFDNDDGIAVYDVELRKGAYEYEVKIDAKTGNVLEFEQDIDD